ncbi:MAG TPA: formylglycine-generating enzyme family protein [Phycisphaerae bacterium]|nr:formylglycine-generating enzyme family protein [Phycisphaerae bacterium]
MALKLFSRKAKMAAARPARTGGARPSREDYVPAERMTLEDDPLQRYIQLGRFGWIARHREQWGDHPLIQAAFEAAIEAIDEHFAIVPEGFVSIAQATSDYPGCPETDIETPPFLLAKWCVTNQQYQGFVDDGGYEDLNLWPEDIWPHLIDFKDQTGDAGPRFWRHGRHDRRIADHPVVGVSCYEAAAYARWAGFRLPTGAEWQMAASWRIRSSAHVLRRYPWGDAFDVRRCNLWASGLGRTVSVEGYEEGAAPNGVLQLIGNVWEWTDSEYGVQDDAGRLVVGDMILKEIRGGAFDTYFPAQATSSFRTGLAGLRRMHNVGFRCIVDLSRAEADESASSDTTRQEESK